MNRGGWRPIPVLLGLGALLLGAVLVGAPVSARQPTPTPVGSDRFIAKRTYSGDFPDPTILRVGRKYFAYSTTVASLNLPVLSSTNLIRWTARKKSGRRTNDAFPTPGRWTDRTRIGKRWFTNTWAPAVTRVGRRYVLAYSAPLAGQVLGPGIIKKYCIGLAFSRRPIGPFLDRNTSPLVCPPDRGAIDPSFFVDPSGQRWLYWKTEQDPRRLLRSQVYAQPLTNQATGFVPGSSPTMLLETQEPWEGILIENPAMAFHQGRYFLFYSGGSYANPTYATGYATCAGPAGPCVRAANSPLLTSGGGVDGPGGASAFVDRAGRLRLAYAAWNQGNFGYPRTAACLRTPAGCPQRHLHIATLAVAADGSLVVVELG